MYRNTSTVSVLNPPGLIAEERLSIWGCVYVEDEYNSMRSLVATYTF